MTWNILSKEQLYSQLFSIIQFQYCTEIAERILANFDDLHCEFSKKTGRIRYLKRGNQLIASYKPTTGTFSLAFDIVKTILPQIPLPRSRVIVQTDVSSFIESGKSVFAKHVIDLDSTLRIGDETFVVDENDRLLALGKLNMPPNLILQMKAGMAVKVRHGSESENKTDEN
jgi:uncharacterized protein with predicted RNA binding PUA domain